MEYILASHDRLSFPKIDVNGSNVTVNMRENKMDNLNNQENQEPIQPVKEGIEPSQYEGSTHMDHSAHMDHAPDMEHTSQSIAHEDHGAHAEKE